MEIIYQIELKSTGGKFLHIDLRSLYNAWGVYLDFTQNTLDSHSFRYPFENEKCIITAKILHTK